VISRDGKWLPFPLEDSNGTDLWIASAADEKLRPIADFGQKRIVIAQRVSWFSDRKYLFTGVGERDPEMFRWSDF
jgi:hypothetical protein